MSDEILEQPAGEPQFQTYPCSLGTVIGYYPGTYRIQQADGLVICVSANSEPSEANVEADIANPPAPPPAAVPGSVGPAQLRIALRHLHSITSAQVLAAIDGIADQTARDDAFDLWEYATQIRRDHPLIGSFTTAFNLTSAQVDDIFRYAISV